MDRKWGVNQIYNESSKTANPLYIKLSPYLPARFSAEALSSKIIATCQTLRSSDFKKIIRYRNVAYHLLNILVNDIENDNADVRKGEEEKEKLLFSNISRMCVHLFSQLLNLKFGSGPPEKITAFREITRFKAD